MNSVPVELQPYVWKPGQSGNPLGRPKEKTIKERVNDWLEQHPDDLQDFIAYFVRKNRSLAWQMLEGRPTDNSKGDNNTNITLNVISYHGDSNKHSIQLDAGEAPASSLGESSEVQGDCVAPQSAQDYASPESVN